MTKMTEYADEPVIPMPPVSTKTLEGVAEAVLGQLCPIALTVPTPLDVLDMIDHVLPDYGIHVYPADIAHLAGVEAHTDPDGEDEIEILLREEYWTQLQLGGRRANRARATVLHEISHAVLHVPVVRRRRVQANADHLLQRVPVGSIKPFRNPEWQAWMLAGAIAMPRRTVSMLTDRSPENVGETFGMSETFARSHLRRLKLT